MLNKFILVAVILQIARAACTPGTETTNCKDGACNVQIGSETYCSQCYTTSEAPVDGVCKAINNDASGCQLKSSADGTCTQCGAGYFLYEGGCYKVAESPGSFICSTEGGAGLCSACKNENGFFKNPSATAATHQSCIACNRTAAVDNVKGVEGCTACGGPDSAGSQGAPTVATCTKCDTTRYLKTAAGATTCVAKENCSGAYFPNDSVGGKKQCIPCGDSANKGIADCTACTLLSSPTDAALITCSACTDGKAPNDAGSACVDAPAPSACPIEGCKTCSADKKTCEECAENKYLTPTNQCISNCATIPGYYGTAENGKRVCKKCGVANCVVCGATGACDLCTDGFYGPSCSKCHESCRTCSGGAGADKCTSCMPGSALTYGSAGNTGTCGEGCVQSSESGAGKCETCGLTVEGTKYCSKCKETSEYPQNGVCATKPTGRATASCKDSNIANGVCATCADGFFKMSGGCYSTGQLPGATVCTSAQTGGTCTKSEPGYNVDSSGALVTCPEGCETCSSANACTKCKDGYVTGTSGCEKCDASCLTCGTNAKTCTACSSGYYKVGDAAAPCTSCEADSGSVKGISGCLSCAPPTGSGPVLCYLMKDSAAGGSDPNLSSGAIAGISVAVIVVVGGLVGFLCWWFICRGKA
ncbi:Variant-specific surface protein [Giardia duodenalis]|uniref:Variant-specific surface protein n=1 Tax=Giardia intestinalis TaxID=5741 RepID=V6TQB6_GIAIN|nr:Variant-specific surface protein [Giardia intestinalis]